MPTIRQMQADFKKAPRALDEFTAGHAPVQKAAREIARALEELQVPYAVAGALAVAANGLERRSSPRACTPRRWENTCDTESKSPIIRRRME